MRFFLFTLGCKINQYESQALREAWIDQGHEETTDLASADVALVHTCAVTAGAVADSRRAVRRAARQAPGIRVVVAGCAAQVDPETFRALPGVALVVPQAQKPGLAAWPGTSALPGGEACGARQDPAPAEAPDRGPSPKPEPPRAPLAESPKPEPPRAPLAESGVFTSDGLRPGQAAALPGSADSASGDSASGEGVAKTPPRSPWPNYSVRGSHRSRPVLKVQDGCSHCCTYCIVPRARGGPRTRPLDAIVDEARRMLERGHREIVLTGINLAQYVDPDHRGDFWDMLARLESALAPDWAGRARLRLSSLDPGMLGPKALGVLKASAEGAAMVCPHLHVSLQSASPAVLAAMGRSHYQAPEILDFLDHLGRIWPLFALGADILTGFPGETEADFQATLDFCRQAPLSYAHVFAYSKRPGTVAAKAKNQVADATKKARSLALRELTARRKRDFMDRLATLPKLTVAPERLDPWTGVCQYYVECAMTPGPRRPGHELLSVRPVRASDAALLVEET